MASSSRVPSRMAWTAGVVMFCFALAPTTAALLDTREAADDRIVSLPGWGPVETGMYGGYITVDAAAGRALYYILAESSDPDAPLLLWLNGGPGCSSIGGGFMTELGPFFPTSDGRLEQNRFSWVGGAGHVLFLESPAFVGFSYSNTTSDRVVGDARTTQDSLAFLQGFFQRFPRLADNAFWITGESYAGHYIPALAQAVLLHNQRVAAQPQDGNQPVINLKGLLAGNPWTDAVSDNIGQIDFLTDHFVLSPETAARIRRDCDIQTVWPLKPRLFLSSLLPRRSDGRSEAHHMSRKCQERFAEAYQEMGGTSVYDVYEDVCLENVAASSMEALLSTFLEQQAPPSAGAGAVPRTDAQRRTGGAAAASRRLLRQRQPWEVGNAVVLDPCVESEAENYLNRPDVQAAIHANVSGHLPWRWTDCSSLVQYNQADAVASMLPVYRFLMQHHSLTLLVYSGDVDASVPATGTKLWLDKLNLTVAEPWRPWKAGFRYGGLQTAGHVVKYQEGISFVTVRGAGHMVPYTQPARALALVSRVVNGQPL